MSSLGNIYSLADLDMQGTYSYADYLSWKFKERVELLKGRISKMSPAPSVLHQRVATELTRQVANFFYKQPCQVFAAPFDVRLLDDDTVVQPDLCVICDQKKLDERGCTGAPDLVVEVLSPGNSKKEMKEKFDIYETAGVQEYWLINPSEAHALVYVLNEHGKFVGLAPVTEEDAIISKTFPDLKIELAELFL
ncbi:MAG: Uma2 family endonuclease [Bacteroidia bacterium]